MLLLQAATALIEKSINTLVALDEQSAQSLNRLSGRRLLIYVKDLDQYFLLAFSSQVQLLLGEADSDNDCFLSLSMDSIPSLMKNQHLTQLIKQDKLDIEGDLHLAQDVANLFLKLEIDWEEKLSAYTGDVAANQIFKMAKSARKQLSSQGEKIRRVMSEGALEEKKIAAPALAVAHYSDQVNELRASLARLDKRLGRLEGQA